MKEQVIQKINAEGIIAILRLAEADDPTSIARAIYTGGVSAIEVTTNTPNYLNAIKNIKESHPQICIGVGTVTTPEQAQAAIEVGVQFLVTPITSEAICQVAIQYDVPIVMGAFSPTEIHMAHQYGADFIKLFPAKFAGPAYLKAVRATLDKNIRIVPTGGVNLSNCAEWFQVGASALGLGGNLVNRDLIAKKDYQGITNQVKIFIEHVREIKKAI